MNYLNFDKVQGPQRVPRAVATATTTSVRGLNNPNFANATGPQKGIADRRVMTTFVHCMNNLNFDKIRRPQRLLGIKNVMPTCVHSMSYPNSAPKLQVCTRYGTDCEDDYFSSPLELSKLY